MTVLSKPRWLARAAGLLLALGALLPLAAPGAALAHERRNVGPYTFVVGWAGEPAFVNQMNGATIRITKTDGGTPVEGADKTLKLALAAGGGQPKELPLRAVFGQPGLYQADLMPTKTGSYIYTVTWTVEGTTVNEKFESGPGRFDDIQPLDKVQFPDVVPAPAQMASTVKTAQDQAQAAQARADAAESQIGQARAFGIAGTVLGVLGLALGALAFTSARRSSGPATAPAGAAPSVART